MGLRGWRPSLQMVHALFALGGFSGVSVPYDYVNHLREPNPLEQYVGIDLDAALEEFFAA